MICVISVLISLVISVLCFSYLPRDSILCLLFCCCGGGLWMIAYVGRWSESGGDIVPDVMCVSMSVVSMTSMSVQVLWCGSSLVGVVIVV